MARVTAGDVQEILTGWGSRPMDAWINAANLLVTTYCAPATSDTALLKEIERNLAAHLATIAIQPRAQSTSSRAGSRTLAPLGEGLAASPWGQTVMALDPDGALTGAINNPKRRKAFIQAHGDSELAVSDPYRLSDPI